MGVVVDHAVGQLGVSRCVREIGLTAARRVPGIVLHIPAVQRVELSVRGGVGFSHIRRVLHQVAGFIVLRIDLLILARPGLQHPELGNERLFTGNAQGAVEVIVTSAAIVPGDLAGRQGDLRHVLFCHVLTGLLLDRRLIGSPDGVQNVGEMSARLGVVPLHRPGVPRGAVRPCGDVLGHVDRDVLAIIMVPARAGGVQLSDEGAAVPRRGPRAGVVCQRVARRVGQVVDGGADVTRRRFDLRLIGRRLRFGLRLRLLRCGLLRCGLRRCGLRRVRLGRLGGGRSCGRRLLCECIHREHGPHQKQRQTKSHQSHPCLGTTVYHRDYLLPAVSKAAAIFHFSCIYAHFFTISRAISYIYCARCAIPFFTIATSRTIPLPLGFYFISVIFLCQGFSSLIFLYYADCST